MVVMVVRLVLSVVVNLVTTRWLGWRGVRLGWRRRW